MRQFTPSYLHGLAPRDFAPRFPQLWQGCIGAWCPSLGPTGTRVHDWSGRGRHLTLNNMDPATDWVLSRGQYSLDTDGSNDYLLATVDGTTLTQLTVSFWINTATSTSTVGFFQWADAITDTTPFMLLTGDGRVLIDNGYRVTLSLTQGQWYHLAISLGADNVWTVWQDGVSKLSYADDATHTFQSSAVGLYWGDGYNGYSAAKFDDMRVYNRRLAQGEVQQLALRRAVAYEPAEYRTSGLQPMRGVTKFYDSGSASWKQAPVKVYTGSSWKNAEPKVYSGGNWY